MAGAQGIPGRHGQRRGQSGGGQGAFHGVQSHGRGVVVVAQMGQHDLTGAVFRQSNGKGGGILVAGMNYGQGSSREHAALVPLYLGIRAVVAKSFARIHQANLINNGILPLTFQNEADYDRIAQGDTLSLPHVRETVESGSDTFVLHNDTKDEDYIVLMPLTARQQGCILYGGLLNYTRKSAKTE